MGEGMVGQQARGGWGCVHHSAQTEFWVGQVWPHSCLCPSDRADSWTCTLTHGGSQEVNTPNFPASTPQEHNMSVQLKKTDVNPRLWSSICIDFLWCDSKQSSAHRNQLIIHCSHNPLFSTATNMFLCWFFYGCLAHHFSQTELYVNDRAAYKKLDQKLTYNILPPSSSQEELRWQQNIRSSEYNSTIQ